MKRDKTTPPKRRFHTDSLFPKTGFLIGLGSILDIFPSFVTSHDFRTGPANDWKAIRNDFGVVGDDLRQAVFELRMETEQKKHTFGL